MHPITIALKLIREIRNGETLEAEHYEVTYWSGGIVIGGCKLTNLIYADNITFIIYYYIKGEGDGNLPRNIRDN